MSLISFFPPPFNYNYYLVDFFSGITVFLDFLIELVSLIAPLFYWNYDLVYFFYCTIVLLQFWCGCFILSHHCFIAILSWLLSSIVPLLHWNYYLAFFFYFSCFIVIIIWLILFEFYYTTVLYQLWFPWCLLLHDCFIGIMIRHVSSGARLFYCKYNLADFFYSTSVFIAIMI